MGLDSVNLILAVEETFGIALENAELEKIATPRELIDLVCRKLPSPPWTREQVAEKIRDLVIAQIGGENIYEEDAQFVRDLGMD